VTCPSDNKTASDTVNIQVTRPPVRTYTFEDVYFDFDATRCGRKRRACSTKRSRRCGRNAKLRVRIEGHTCSIGTAEYNLAARRSPREPVKELPPSAVASPRIGCETVSYGEERPKYDNTARKRVA